MSDIFDEENTDDDTVTYICNELRVAKNDLAQVMKRLDEVSNAVQDFGCDLSDAQTVGSGVETASGSGYLAGSSEGGSEAQGSIPQSAQLAMQVGSSGKSTTSSDEAGKAVQKPPPGSRKRKRDHEKLSAFEFYLIHQAHDPSKHPSMVEYIDRLILAWNEMDADEKETFKENTKDFNSKFSYTVK